MKPPKGCRRRVNCNSIFGLVFIVLIYGSKYVNVHLGFQFKVKHSLSWRTFVNCTLVQTFSFFIQQKHWRFTYYYYFFRLNAKETFFGMFKDHLMNVSIYRPLVLVRLAFLDIYFVLNAINWPPKWNGIYVIMQVPT